MDIKIQPPKPDEAEGAIPPEMTIMQVIVDGMSVVNRMGKKNPNRVKLLRCMRAIESLAKQNHELRVQLGERRIVLPH